MLRKIYYIKYQDILTPSFLETLKEKYQFCSSDFDSESLISDICSSNPDLIILNISPKSQLVTFQLLKSIQSKIERPFIICTDNIDDLIIDELLNFDIYGVFSNKISSNEFLININIAFKRFREDKKNRDDKYFLNEAERLSSIGHWRLDIKRDKLEWSDETYRIFERDRSLGGISYDEFNEAIHPDDRGKVNDAYIRSIKQRKVYEIEHRILVNNKVKYVIEKCETFYHNDEPILSLGTVQDITSRKKIELELERSKKNFNEVFQSSSEKNSLIDPEHLIILKNKFIAAKKLGYLDKNISRKDFYEIVNSKKTYSQLLKSVKKLSIGEQYEAEASLIKEWIEHEFVQKQAQLQEININLNREVELKNEKLQNEINEKKKAQELQQVFFNVIEQSSDLIMIASLDGKIEYVNPAFCDYLHYENHEIIGENTSFFRSDIYDDSYYKNIWNTIKSGRSFSDEFIGKKKNGEAYMVSQIILPIKNLEGQITQFASISRDVTDRKKLDKRLIDVQEEERSRISRELHDGIGQSVAIMKLSLNQIAEKHNLPQEEMSNILNMLASLRTSVREMSYDLMPSVLKDYGLITATRKMIKHIESNTKMNIYFKHSDETERFSEDIELSLFRILQESLNNAMTKSKATEIFISIIYANDIIQLVIKDNGDGFDYNDEVEKTGQGIRNMKHRANLINGFFQLRSSDKGTEVSVKVPLKS